MKNRILIYIVLLFIFPGMAASQNAWPVRGPVRIGAQFHDFQNYGKVPYLHGGLDVRAPAGTVVYTPVSGRVTISSYRIEASRVPLRFAYIRSPFTPSSDLSSKYIEVSIVTKDGTNWCFRHLDPGSIPYHLLSKAQSGADVVAGDSIGNVVPWTEPVLPVTEKYDHIHLEVIASDGSYLNPVPLLEPVPDTQAPTIHGIWAVPNEETVAFAGANGNLEVFGDIDFVLAVTDSLPGGGYLYSPYRVRASIRRLEAPAGIVIPFSDVFKFDRLPIRGDRTQLGTVIYKERLKTPMGVLESNGAGGPRFFLMNLTNGNPALGYKPEYALRTSDLADGRYALDVEASDIAGNTASATLGFTVRNRR
ncbi:MAG TPA: hypothetical protein PLU72_06145 [Candidatus Ozemobacteraceae bacterium]|nr:hypothetical protein [Candidatus Ozemobacteraceae bacterium]HQG27304.1 hypothetical protein [Candidatus Ozemobacteraceae bacterium]